MKRVKSINIDKDNQDKTEITAAEVEDQPCEMSVEMVNTTVNNPKKQLTWKMLN